MSRRARWYLALALATVLVGCDGTFTVTRYLDVERLESTIADGLEEQTGLTIESVDCPDEIAMEAGNEFECTAVDSGGSTAAVTVTQDDADGNITWSVGD